MNLRSKLRRAEEALQKCWEGWDDDKSEHYCKVCGGGMDDKNYFVVHKKDCIWLELQTCDVGAQMRDFVWHYDKVIPKPYEVLAILKSESGGFEFDKVNSLFPIDDYWEVVCWAHVPIDAIASDAPQSAIPNESACT